MRSILIIAILQLLVSCSKKTPALEPPKLADDATYTFKIDKNNVPADNESEALVSLQANKPVFNKQVIVTINKGSFADNSQIITLPFLSGATLVQASIKHNRAESVKVTATISNVFSDNENIQFVPALPDTALINTVNTLAPKLTSKASITTQLNRNTGVVTEGTAVFFEDSSASVNLIGTFTNTTKSNESGVVTTDYWIQDTTFKEGFVYIRAFIFSSPDKKKKVIGKNKIYIK